MAKNKQGRMDSSIIPSLKGKESTRSKPVRNGRSQQGKFVSVNPPCDKDGILIRNVMKKVVFEGKVYWVSENLAGHEPKTQQTKEQT